MRRKWFSVSFQKGNIPGAREITDAVLADSIESALTLAKKHRPAGVVLHINYMPKKRGYFDFEIR